MSLIKCPNCERDISDKAKKCPGCGWKPGNKKEVVKLYEGETNAQNIESVNELEEEYQKSKQLEDKVIKLESRIVELNNAAQEIENLKRLVKKINNEKMSLLEQINAVSSQEWKVTDNIDYESMQNLQKENLLLKNNNQILQKENADLKSINEKQFIDNKKESANIIIKRKDSINDVAEQADEKEKDNIVSNKMIEVPSFEPKEGGYNQGDVICEISGVSIIYESCQVDDENTMFTFKCINNGEAAYEVRAKNIAVNRIMMGGDYFTTDEITVGNQGELSFWYSNEFLKEECGDFQELNLTMAIKEEYSEVDSVDGIYLYP